MWASALRTPSHRSARPWRAIFNQPKSRLDCQREMVVTEASLTPASPNANALFLITDMIVQIYEVTTADEARALSGFGVDHIGVLVGDGAFPREQSIEQAGKIFAAISAPSKSSALSLSADLNWISKIVSELNPAILHLGAHTDLLLRPAVAALKRGFPLLPIMRSIPVVGKESVPVAKAYN